MLLLLRIVNVHIGQHSLSQVFCRRRRRIVFVSCVIGGPVFVVVVVCHRRDDQDQTPFKPIRVDQGILVRVVGARTHR